MSQLDPNLCPHTHIIPGLSAIQCRDCRRYWEYFHKDFERLLAQSSDPPEDTTPRSDTESKPKGGNFVLAESDTESYSYPEILRFTDEPINLYYPRGTAKSFNQYFRFSYRDGKRMRHLHIPGGNTRSPEAIERAKRVRAFVDEGATPSQVRSLIEGWQTKKNPLPRLF
ncbi:hypothetical protein [Synechocystis sp. PCC 7509]|uniref:hypothetical protein n=1 Tax=Synechocystis sp. PCC 7509 TaxID=927677 RepID=UPI0002ABCC7F|nr:hypothetical protein [Synechocystis sp. PCC 7509]